MHVVITGSGGSVGRRVAANLLEAHEVESVRGVDLTRPRSSTAAFKTFVGDLRMMDLTEVFDGADVLIHLASAFDPSRDYTDAASLDSEATAAVLAAAGAAGVRRLVLLSSAMVYGAYDRNPLPLTEAAETHPNAGYRFAEHKLEIEQLAQRWRAEFGAGAIATLRPTTAVAAGESSWVARSMRVSAGLAADAAPPVQFLHLDDLADAVCIAALNFLDGVYNVAPDGWASADEVRQLTGRAPRLRLSTTAAGQIAEAGWRHRLAPTPPGIVPYITHPWVVANDKLRATGWEPSYSNVEAYVEGHSARPWAMINSKRRQQLALGAAGTVVAAGVSVAGVLARRMRNNR